jgi:hypothetical protein
MEDFMMKQADTNMVSSQMSPDVSRRSLVQVLAALGGATAMGALRSPEPVLAHHLGTPRIVDVVNDFGARGDGKTDDTMVIQNAIDSLGPDGGEVFLPPGTYMVSKSLVFPLIPALNCNGRPCHPCDPAPLLRSVLIRGAGKEASKIRALGLDGPVFTWDVYKKAVDPDTGLPNAYFPIATFRDLYIENLTPPREATALIMKWDSREIEFQRLFLNIDNVNVDYACILPGRSVAALELNFLFFSHLSNMQIKGGSGFGWGIKFTGSNNYFENIYFTGGDAGSAMQISGGGTHIIVHTRIDSGSRGLKPAYHLDNTRHIVFNGLYGEPSDQNPFLLIDGSYNITVINPDLPTNTLRGDFRPYINNNIVEIKNSKNILFLGGAIGDQAGVMEPFGGTGKAVDIDEQSDFIRFLHTTIRSVREPRDSTPVERNIRNRSSGGSVFMELLEGGDHILPPTAFKVLGTKQLQNLAVGGISRFATVGSGIIPARQNATAVTDDRVGPESHIMVTLNGNPGLNRAVSWVKNRHADSSPGFTVVLNLPALRDTPFTYFIVN